MKTVKKFDKAQVSALIDFCDKCCDPGHDVTDPEAFKKATGWSDEFVARVTSIHRSHMPSKSEIKAARRRFVADAVETAKAKAVKEFDDAVGKNPYLVVDPREVIWDSEGMPIPEMKGIYLLDALRSVAHTLDVTYQAAFGRGTEARRIVEALRLWLNAGKVEEKPAEQPSA